MRRPEERRRKTGLREKSEIGGAQALRTREEAKRVDALDFTIRGTLGIIYYLGEIALGDPRLDADAAQLVRPYLTFHGDTRDKTDVLFELRPTKATRI